MKYDVQCSTLEYLTDVVGDVIFEGTGVEWMVGCVYSEAWNKHGKASMSDHKPKTYKQTGCQYKTNIYIRYENNTREIYARKTFLNIHTQIYSCTNILKKGQLPTNQPTQGKGCNRGWWLHPHWCPCSSSCFSSFFSLLLMLFFIPILMLILSPQWWCAT